MKLKTSFRILLALCLTSNCALAAPSAEEILAVVRMQQSRQDLELHGKLRENERVVPFRLTQSGPVVRYIFTDPDETLQLRLGENNSRLEDITKSGVDKISGAEFERKVRGTAITYEDLALRFLYWPNARVIGEDNIKTRRSWELELLPPGRQSQYSRVLIWCDQKSGALLKVEGFGGNGKLIRRFEVVSVQEIDGRYFLKRMRVEELAPDTGKTQSRTYFEIDK